MGSDNYVVIVFAPNFPPYISSNRNNTLDDLQKIVGGYLERVPNEIVNYRQDLDFKMLLKELLKKKTTTIYCNESATIDDEVNKNIFTLYGCLYGTIIVEVKEKVFNNWYNKFNIYIPTFDNNFHKKYFTTQEKIALMKMGRNSIINNYLLQKVFIKRLSLDK